MKKLRCMLLSLIVLLTLNTAFVLSSDSGHLAVNAVQSPPYNSPKDLTGDELKSQVDGICDWGSSPGIYPLQISDNTKFNPGDTLEISSPSGSLCLDSDGWSLCKACCFRGDGCESTSTYTDSNLKIGFFRTNSMTSSNTPISEVTFSSVVNNGIEIPDETNYIYAYYTSSNYYSKNPDYEVSFDYNILGEQLLEWKVMSFSSNSGCSYDKIEDICFGYSDDTSGFSSPADLILLNSSSDGDLRGDGLENQIYSKIVSGMPQNYKPCINSVDTYSYSGSRSNIPFWAGSKLRSYYVSAWSCTIDYGITGSREISDDTDFINSPVYEVDLYDWDGCGYSCKNVIRYAIGPVPENPCIPNATLHLACSGNTQVCEDGWGYCDGSLSDEDGCETQLGTDTVCSSCSDDCTATGQVCESMTCVDVPLQPHWSNLIGNYITQANPGDYVKIVSSGSPPYNITDDGELIETINENIWFAENVSIEGYNFSSPDGTSVNDTSLLNVTGDEENDPMSLDILEPACGSYNYSGQEIVVVINASDADDLITGNLTIGDDTYYFNNSNGPIINISHLFDEAGTIKVTAYANNSRGSRNKVSNNVMIVDNTSSGGDTQYYVASCIDSPKNFDNFTNSRVFFNASSSRAVKFTKPNTLEIIPPERLYFEWTFFHKSTNSWSDYPCKGLGSEPCFAGGDGTTYSFWRTFAKVNDNIAYLSVSIPDTELN